MYQSESICQVFSLIMNESRRFKEDQIVIVLTISDAEW